MVLVAAVLAAGTILERVNPEVHIYTSWWFVAIMALVALAAIVSIVQAKMWRRPELLLIHASVVAILLGGALTTWVGRSGEMLLHPDQPSRSVANDDGSKWQLPFDVTLRSFEVVSYPGTRTPMDFVSHIVCEGEQYDISMNHIYRHRGYRFYQSDYDPDGNSILSVAHDLWGIVFTYLGYLMLLLGLGWLLARRDGPFRRMLGSKVASLALPALLAVSLAASAQPTTLPRQSADKLGQMYMLYKGRVCPVQTFAKDFTTKLTGKATYRGLSSEQVLAGFLFYYDEWASEPLIKVKKAGTWHLDDGDHSVDSRSSVRQLAFLEWVKLPPSADKNQRAAQEKYNLVRMISSGKILKLYPIADTAGTISWYAQNDVLPPTVADDEYLFVRNSIGYCQELVVKGDMPALDKVFEKTLKYQRDKAADVLPSGVRTAAERLYNRLTTGRWLAMMCIAMGLLAFAGTLVLMARNKELPRAARVAEGVYMAVLTAFLLLIFVLRWIAGGHVPMAGGFDSMNLMSIAIGLVSLAMARRHPVALPVGMLTVGFCQLVAMMSGSNPPVTNLMPVLNSPLLTLHVTVIMFAYALFFAVALCCLGGLATLRHADVTDRLQRMSLTMLYPAVTLLALGIVIGAVWANISWGNYWSWDPKEVWALITLIVYVIPIHPGSGLQRRRLWFHLYCLLALLSVAITYFGVNLILGGMHSYGA